MVLKLPEDIVRNISFHEFTAWEGRHPNGSRLRPIVAKFKHFEQKEQVKQAVAESSKERILA